MKRKVAADIRAIFNAATRHDAETLLAQAVQKYSPKASALADWPDLHPVGQSLVFNVQVISGYSFYRNNVALSSLKMILCCRYGVNTLGIVNER